MGSVTGHYPKAIYLGDGLYMSWDGYQFKLMANDLEHPTDTVYLDVQTFRTFVELANDILKNEN